jgi:hypothetical protein
MSAPSTAWKEIISPDEEARFARQADLIRAAHAIKNAKYSKGRCLHRKPLLAADAKVEIFDALPEPARAGLFERPGTYKALVRLSNGAFDIQANTKPDIRGFALKVEGLSGPGALGGTTDHQDFLLINHDRFAARTSDEFVGLVAEMASKGELSGVWMLFKTYGLGGALQRLKALAGTLGKPFPGFAAETFSTVLPITVGAYAARLRVKPRNPMPRGNADIAADIAAKLAQGPIVYDIELQFFVDEATTPIEDPTVAWPEAASPFMKVGALTLLKAGADVEGLAFDPWSGLAAHRPLGEIMRARKGAYYLSQTGRK